MMPACVDVEGEQVAVEPAGTGLKRIARGPVVGRA